MALIFFIIYLLIFGHLASAVLDKFFGFSNKFTKKVLGIFTVFVTLGWIAGAAVLFLPLRFWVLTLVFVLNAILHIVVAKWSKKKEINIFTTLPKDELYVQNIFSAKIGVVVFLGLVAYGLYRLASSQTGNAIVTPWEVIKSPYIIIFFCSTFLLGLLVFAKLKSRTILVCLMLQFFLLCSYLPLTHTLIYGADGWRHVANEQRILEGKMFKAAELRTEDIGGAKSQILNSKFQNFKTKISQLSYSNFWASNVIVAKLFKGDLLRVTRWFLPVIWSLVFPLILFEIAVALGWGKHESFFVAWLGLLPFAWQAAGSFSLPVSFGLLIWLFVISLLLKRMVAPAREQKTILALMGVGLLCGYALYAILFWLAWAVEKAVFYILNRGPRAQASGRWQSRRMIALTVSVLRRFRLFGVAIIVALVVPVIELIAGYSQVDKQLSIFAQLKQMLGNITGFYLASGPRPHDIATGNILFNQAPAYAFIANIFTFWRYWIVAFSIGFLLLVVYGLYRTVKQKQLVQQWLAVMSAGLISGYIITNYLLAGSHILARRLDGVVALFLISLFFCGLYSVLVSIKNRLSVYNFKSIQLSIHIIGIFILSIAITASYSLGPDTFAVSSDEYVAASYIWSIEKEAGTTCVLGDTYPLLALEAISAKEIIGGNFPIDANFGQPERVQLFDQMNMEINSNLLTNAAAVTGADHCWFMGGMENFQNQGVLRGVNAKVFGDTAVVRYSILSL